MTSISRKDRKFKFETLQLHVGQEQADPATDSRAVPIYQTTSYVFHNSQHAADRFGLKDAGNIYGRLTNSTQGAFEDRIAALESGVAGLAVSNGVAAISYVIQALAKSGEHIVAQKTIYGGTSNLLGHTYKNIGIDTTFVDEHNLEEIEAAIQDNTKAFIWKRWEIQTAIFLIWMPSVNWLINMDYLLSWIIHLEHLISFVQSNMVQILWFIRQLNSSVDMERL